MSTRSPVSGCVKASRAAWRNCRSSPRSPPIPYTRVTRERQPDRLEVHPDLVRPPRLEPDTQQRALAHEALDLEEGDGLTRRRGVERVPRGVVTVAADRRLDAAAPRAWVTLDERHVLALELAPADEALHDLVRLGGARHHQQPRRVAVEPVDDSRPVLAPPAMPRASSPCTSVPLVCPGVGWTTTPAGLSTTSRCTSS